MPGPFPNTYACTEELSDLIMETLEVFMNEDGEVLVRYGIQQEDDATLYWELPASYVERHAKRHFSDDPKVLELLLKARDAAEARRSKLIERFNSGVQ